MDVRSLTFVTLCLLATHPLASAARVGESGPAAIVAELQGSVTVREQGERQRPLQLFDWINEGALISVAKGARVVVILESGARFALQEGARATLSRAGLPSDPRIERLPALPPLPTVAPLADSRGPAVSAATRLRGRSIRNMYPLGHTTLAERTSLRFEGPNGVAGYRVTIEDEVGSPVFQLETERAPVLVPPGVLEPGRNYSWQVTLFGASTPLNARARFATLSHDTARARSVLRSSLDDQKVADLVLFARIDERLGLLQEARDGLAMAAASAPEDEVVQRMLTRIEQQLR